MSGPWCDALGGDTTLTANRSDLVTSARDFAFMLDGCDGKGNLAPAIDYITRLADRVRDGKHSIPGLLVQIERAIGTNSGASS